MLPAPSARPRLLIQLSLPGLPSPCTLFIQQLVLRFSLHVVSHASMAPSSRSLVRVSVPVAYPAPWLPASTPHIVCLTLSQSSDSRSSPRSFLTLASVSSPPVIFPSAPTLQPTWARS